MPIRMYAKNIPTRNDIMNMQIIRRGKTNLLKSSQMHKKRFIGHIHTTNRALTHIEELVNECYNLNLQTNQI